MGGSIEKLRKSLDLVRQYVNDHDYIASCRPVDIQVTLRKIDQQQAEIERLQSELAYAIEQRRCECSHDDACRFARERDEAIAKSERVQ